MTFTPVNNEQYYVLVAPDGSWQGMTLAPDFPTCVAVIKMLHKKGMSESFHELCVVRKFKILPVRITMVQDGDENTPFKKD